MLSRVMATAGLLLTCGPLVWLMWTVTDHPALRVAVAGLVVLLATIVMSLWRDEV